jgi:hypothetical protein
LRPSTWLDGSVIGSTQPTSDPAAAGVNSSDSRGADTVRHFCARDPNVDPLAFSASAFKARLREPAARGSCGTSGAH